MSEKNEISALPLPETKRKAILYLEALGLIHDLGKMTDRFLASKGSNASAHEKNYRYRLFIDPRKIYQIKENSKLATEWQTDANNHNCAFSERTDLTDHLKAVTFKAWDDKEYSLAELVPFLSQTTLWNKPDIIQDIQEEFDKCMQPGLLIGYLHGVAHFDKEDNTKATQYYEDVWRSTPFGYDEEKIPVGTDNGLTAILEQIPLNSEEIQSIIHSVESRKNWLSQMKICLGKGIADNRRPINDVTLWDWGYLVASLTKAAANHVFRNGWPASMTDLPFQTLRININKLALYTESDKITDLLGKQKKIKESYEQVQALLEFDLALGNRIYHDETGDYYLLPASLSEHERNRLKISIQNVFRENLQEELIPRVYFGNTITAGNLDIKQNQDKASVISAISQLLLMPRDTAAEEPPVQSDNNLYVFEHEWNEERPDNAEICSVCGQRPVGFPAEKTNPKIESKLAPWAKQIKAEERHVCRICLDRRGRRAEQWKNSFEPSSSSSTIWTDEVADDHGRIALFVGCFGLKHWLDGSALETTRLSLNTAKNPSPARLLRISETTRTFWEKINKQLLPEKVSYDGYRLCIVPENPEKLDLGEFHTYEIECKEIKLAVVWDGKNFLSIENLNALARRQGFAGGNCAFMTSLSKQFKQSSLTLSNPSTYGEGSSKISRFRVTEVSTAPHQYKPIIPLLEEPGLCLSLLPANKALEFALSVLKLYKKEMNRVQDRLPMGIGLVFYPRRTPVRAVLEAGNAMLNMLKAKTEEHWEILEPRKNGEIQLPFKNGCLLKYDKEYGSSKPLEDKWHLWCFDNDHKPTKITDLKQKNKISVYPGRFDFEFLDTSSRRFDICYDNNGQRPRKTLPLYLHELEHIDILWQHLSHLKKSQINQVLGLIETKREEWKINDEVFFQFVQDTLAGAEWPQENRWKNIPPSDRHQLISAGVRGSLADVVGLYMRILKYPLKENIQP